MLGCGSRQPGYHLKAHTLHLVCGNLGAGSTKHFVWLPYFQMIWVPFKEKATK